jgi:F-type H+-transporting ATPase subunit gamma
MGAQLRAVRRRIRTVQSTAKITRAQELIASSRIIKAQQRVRDSQAYAREISRAVSAVVSRSAQVDHPLTRPVTEPSRAAVLILTSDRGFCGGYNASVLREAQALIARLGEEGRTCIRFVAGRKGIGWHRFRDLDMAATWSGFSETPRSANAAEITRALLDAFGADEAGDGASPDGAGPDGAVPDRAAGDRVDEIYVVYTEFVSMLTQRPVIHRMLPLEIEDTTEDPPGGPLSAYEFEPSAQEVLDALLPWYVESRIYHALLDASAAEIAARRKAMKSATDNAHELIDNLTLEANKARQAEITQEISEIVGGANALAESIAGSK